jgi:hypothetical protein
MHARTSKFWTTSLLLAAFLPQPRALAAPAKDDGEGVCLDAFQLEQVAIALKELEVCKKEVVLRERLIEEAKLTAQPTAAWWQEPAVIGGGIVMSFGIGSILAFYLARGK